MYSEADYSINDYRYYELYHHGIMGQKWGRKNGPPYPLGPSDHSANEKKAGWRQSLDKRGGLAARTVDRIDRHIDTISDIARNVKETKGLRGKASELAGHGAMRTIARNNAITEQKLANHSKTKLGKRLHEVRAENASSMADYHEGRKKVYEHNALIGLAADLTPRTFDSQYLNTKYKRLSGRETTHGKQALDNILTGGAAGIAMDAIYLHKNRKKNNKK